jgi:hypothetical protein
MRIRVGPFFADILHDSKSTLRAYHYIIQRDGSNQILLWNQESTEEAAKKAAEAELRRFQDEHDKAAS